MARDTRSSFNLRSNLLTLVQSMATALATLASGKNTDDTDYVVPVDAGAVTATPYAAKTTDVQGVAAADGLRLVGYSIREAAASAAVATVRLRNGTADTDPILAIIELAADASSQITLPEGGLDAADGVFVEVVAGEVDIVLYSKVVGQ
jgi:hypothetical protein